MYFDAALGFALTAVSLVLLFLAGQRIVSTICPTGLDRFLATAVVVACGIVGEGLVLGLVGLGTTPIALLVASGVVLAAIRLALPDPEQTLRDEIAGWWRGTGRAHRIAAGGIFGLFGAYVIYAVVDPTLEFDSTYFHLPQVTGWIQNGSPGSSESIATVFPVSAYPLTNETLMAWLGGLSQNIGVILIWPVVAGALLAAAVAQALRLLKCGPLVIGLTVFGLLLIPMTSDSLTSLDTDLASTTWVAVCAALCVSISVRKAPPEALAFALLALALAVGTKTSVAPIGVLAVLAAIICAPRRPRAAPIGAALLVAVGVGGFWYLRNLADHGSLLWPFVNLPGGDPLPASISSLSTSFIENPFGTLDGRVGAYLDEIGSAWLLFAGALFLPLFTRDRRMYLAAGAVFLALLSWSLAPVTGAPDDESVRFFTATGARYLLPAIVLCFGVVGAVAGRGGKVGVVATATLGASVIWGVVDFASGHDGLPAIWIPLTGILAGAVAAWAASRPAPARVGGRGVAVGAGACVVIAGLAIAAYPANFLDRYTRTPPGTVENGFNDTGALYAGLVNRFEALPAYADGDGPILFEGAVVGPLTGGSFDHGVELVDPGWSCSKIAEEGRGGWVVGPPQAAGVKPAPVRCFAGQKPLFRASILGGAVARVFRAGDAGAAAGRTSKSLGKDRPVALLLPAGGFILPAPAGVMDPAARAARASGFQPKELDYPVKRPIASYRFVRAAAERLVKSGHRVVAYGDSAGGTLAARLAEQGLVEAAVATSPPSNLVVWGRDLDYRLDWTLADRRFLSPALHPSTRPIRVYSAPDDPVAPFAANRIWAERDPKVNLTATSGGHVFGNRPKLYEPNAVDAFRWLARQDRESGLP